MVIIIFLKIIQLQEGSSNKAYSFSTAFGTCNVVQDYSFATGEGLSVNNYSFAFGLYNETIFGACYPCFYMGNGTSTSRSNNFAIGTSIYINPSIIPGSSTGLDPGFLYLHRENGVSYLAISY